MIQADAPEKLKQYIQVAIENRAKQESYVFVVFDKRTNQYAGSTRFYDIQLSQATLQLGYTWYGKSFQGSGINKQCKFLMLDFAFDVLKMERVELRGDTENARSIQAMKSIGCEVDGILRSNMIRPDGSRRDSIVLSILRNEWFSHKKALLKAKIDAI